MPDLLVQREQAIEPLPEPIDEIIARCRTSVMAAAHRLVVVDENARIASAAHARGQRRAIGSNASTTPLPQVWPRPA